MQIPPEFFRAGETWFVAGVPNGAAPEDAMDATHVISGRGNVFLPLFTSQERAARYTVTVFGANAAQHSCHAFRDLRKLGAFLDALIGKGCTYVLFDPERSDGAASISVHDVRDALYRTIVVPPPSDN